MADLTKFRQTDVGQSDDFYANYITRDGVNMLANLTNPKFANFFGALLVELIYLSATFCQQP